VDTVVGLAGAKQVLDGVGVAARIGYVGGMTLAAGDLYFTERENHTIRKISLQPGDFGTVTTVVGSSGVSGDTNAVGVAARLSNPDFLASTSTALYFHEVGKNQIKKVELSNMAVSLLAGAGNSNCEVVDATGLSARFCSIASLISDGRNSIYAMDTTRGLIRKVRLSDAQVTTFAGIQGQIKDSEPGLLSTRTLSPNTTLSYAPDQGLLLTNGLGIKIIH
jgi:hypothetical protein